MRATLITCATVCISLSLGQAGTARAAAIYYMPATGGNWSVAANWNLNRCPQPGDLVCIEAGSNDHKSVTYDWTGATSLLKLTVDGNTSGTYATVLQFDHTLITEELWLGWNGPGWYWMEGPAFLQVNGNMYVGAYDPGTGHFNLDVDGAGSGLYVGGHCALGYYGAGVFDHLNGTVEMDQLGVGEMAPGTYWLRAGSGAPNTLLLHGHLLVGHADEGLFEQTGGTATVESGVLLGTNTPATGTYLMKGGTLNAGFILIGLNGNGYFTQTGGTVTATNGLHVGSEGTHTDYATYKVNSTDNPATVNVGGDLFVGPLSLAKYEQTGATVHVAGNLEIWDGADDPYDYSYVYLGTSAGLLDVEGSVTNHTGYYDQDGGVMTTGSFTNDSPIGVNLDNNADFRATVLNHTQGTLWMWRNATVRGELFMPPNTYTMCNFTNNATFQMGSATFDGGTFVGHLTNNGTFTYNQGDFSSSTLTNYGTFNNNAAFACNRLVNHDCITVTSAQPITASGNGYASAFENHGELVLQGGGQVYLGAGKPLVNNGCIFGGGTVAQNTSVNGNLINNNYLCCTPTDARGMLRVAGDFTANGDAELRICVGGVHWVTDYDQLRVTGTAHLGGELDVRLVNGFVPAVGHNFSVVTHAGYTGVFDTVNLPTLPAGRYWWLHYLPTSVRLEVTDVPHITGDVNCDGQVGFGDINPFVLYLSNNTAWQAAYPDCPAENGDINGDGVYPSFLDINPFVQLLSWD